MLIKDIERIIDDPARVSINKGVLEEHSQDLLSYHGSSPPDIVVYPVNEREISELVQYAHEKQIPLIPYGAGTSVEGQIVATKGGICLNFNLMDRILEVRERDFSVVVQPGVTREQLNDYLKGYGLFFPVDPGANATIGGMTATNASGTQTVRYGNMRENVLGLEVVLANGTIIRTGGKSFKSSAGYNLTNLFVGSEGTLGIFSKIILKVYGIPESLAMMKIVFRSVEEACSFAHEVQMYGIPVNKMELLDENTIKAINSFHKESFPESPTLLLEIGGFSSVIDTYLKVINEILQGYEHIHQSVDHHGGKRLWKIRHDVAMAILAQRPGGRLLTTDVCVPLSQLPQAVTYTRKVMNDLGLNGAILGHVGDGNFHAALLIDPANADELERAHEANEKIVLFALEKEGTCSGEHGIGIGKKKFLKMEHGEALEVMKLIKSSLDPKHTFNPGKIFY